MDRSKLVGFWAFGGVVAVSLFVMVVLLVGMWGLSRIFLDPFVEVQDGTSLIQSYQKLASDEARIAHLKNFARAHQPLFTVVSTTAAPETCDAWLGYVRDNLDKAASILKQHIPQNGIRDIYATVNALPENEFIRYQAYSSAGVNLLRQYIARCGN